jgi:DNA-binding transcriptional ArsR family regulator
MPLDDHTSFYLASLFSPLSDPTRVCIVGLLLDRELSVGAIAVKLGMTKILCFR